MSADTVVITGLISAGFAAAALINAPLTYRAAKAAFTQRSHIGYASLALALETMAATGCVGFGLYAVQTALNAA